MGCDDAGVAVEEHLRISIHAPQWGATCSQCIHVRAFGISIHAPQWGATCIVIAINHGTTNFNPRTPVGCDQMPRRQRQSAWNFNPRTPVGCDWWMTSITASSMHFNPRTPVGCDLSLPARLVTRNGFQSTHPSGVRPSGLRKHHAHRAISIHAPQWGATTRSSRYVPHNPDFNPRTPVGCDQRSGLQFVAVTLFQSTHPSGVRLLAAWGAAHMPEISIHAPQWGATRSSGCRTLRAAYFNPRTPVGCDWRLSR